MTARPDAPELSAAERERADRIEAAPAAEESWKVLRDLSEALGQLAMRGGYGLGVLASERLAVALLSVVRKIAADELRAAADWAATSAIDIRAVCDHDRARADALDPQ